MYMPSIFNNSVFDNFDNWMDFPSNQKHRMELVLPLPADEDGCQGNR